MRILTVLVVSALAVACPVYAPPGEIQVSGPWTHAASGFEFPEQVGDFSRAYVSQFDDAGTRIAVGYNHETADALIALTVYVGPPVVLETGTAARLEEQFELEKEAIHDAHPGATELWSEPGTVVNEIGSLSAFSAGFQYSEVFAFLPQSVESRLYLFDSAGWIVKYRVTHSMGQAAAGRRIVQDFLRSAPWGRTVPAA